MAEDLWNFALCWMTQYRHVPPLNLRHIRHYGVPALLSLLVFRCSTVQTAHPGKNLDTITPNLKCVTPFTWHGMRHYANRILVVVWDRPSVLAHTNNNHGKMHSAHQQRNSITTYDNIIHHNVSELQEDTVDNQRSQKLALSWPDHWNWKSIGLTCAQRTSPSAVKRACLTHGNQGSW